MLKFIKNNLNFSKLAGINLFSRIGDRLFYTAMLTSASYISQSNLAITIISTSETIPILLSFILGSISDQKRNKAKSLINNSIIRFIVFLIIGLLFYRRISFSLIILVSVLNLLSGIAGNYSSALISPFTKILVNANEMEQAQGIISITAQLINVVATFLGSILLTFFNDSMIAFMNALIFLLVTIGFWCIKPVIQKYETKIHINPYHSSIIKIVKHNLSSLIKNKLIFNDLFQLTLINGFFGGLTPIFVIFLKVNDINRPFSRPILIAILPILITIAMISGNFLSSKYFKKFKNTSLNKIANYFIIIVGIGFFLNRLSIIIIFSSLTALILGIISPRFTAKIVNTYRVENLGGVITTVNSLLVLMPPLTSLIFPSFLTINILCSYLFFIVYGTILIVISKIILR